MRYRPHPIFILLALSLVSGEVRESAAAAESSTAIVALIQESRTAKDSLMRYGSESPIPEPLRAKFEGLRYFPIDLKYRLVGDLHLYGRRRQIQIPMTDSSSIPMERFGRFVTQLEGKPFWLEIYRSLEENSLLVFFKDATNGSQTYGGGRYARLRQLDNGRYLLDFNGAYNPYCAYDPNYICPLPPLQNHLSFAIRAGEMNYGADLAH